jgi:hypothetical protein
MDKQEIAFDRARIQSRPFTDHRVCFQNGRYIFVAVPQGLKPLALSALFGTTEVVP